MKVLLINNCHRQRGGADIVYFGTAQILLEAGHEVVFFSFADDNNEKTGCPEYFIHWGGKLRQLRNYFCNKDAARTMEKILLIEKPDIAHAHLMWGGMTGAIIPILHKHGVPLVHSVHDYRMICPAYTFRNGRGQICESCKTGGFIQCVKNRCAKGSLVKSALMAYEMSFRNKRWHPAEALDGIIYVSHFARIKHEELEPRFSQVLSEVLYNISTVGDTFPPLEKDSGYYLYYGRLSGEKGIETLVNAFSNHPELNLKIVGAGPIESWLRQKQYSNIECLGFKSGEELYNLVRNARFVCVPSEWYENNPMTIVEAYSMGVPVIGARIGGIPEIVLEGETGFLFESGNQVSLDSAIGKCLDLSENAYQTMKRNAREFAQKHFNSALYSDRLVAFYEEVIRSFHGTNKRD